MAEYAAHGSGPNRPQGAERRNVLMGFITIGRSKYCLTALHSDSLERLYSSHTICHCPDRIGCQ